MSGFEFFFSLYGLVLGLSVVEIIGGVARLTHDAKGVRIGLLTPVLITVLLTDLCGFWVTAYLLYNEQPLNYLIVVLSLFAASLYYLAAAIVLPRDLTQEPDLDAVYLQHRRLIMACIAIAGLVMFELIPSLTPTGFAQRLAFWTTLSQSWQPLTFFLCIGVIMLTRNKMVNLALMVLMLSANVASFLRLPSI
jgi:hypothetical protein